MPEGKKVFPRSSYIAIAYKCIAIAINQPACTSIYSCILCLADCMVVMITRCMSTRLSACMGYTDKLMMANIILYSYGHEIFNVALLYELTS